MCDVVNSTSLCITRANVDGSRPSLIGPSGAHLGEKGKQDDTVICHHKIMATFRATVVGGLEKTGPPESVSVRPILVLFTTD